ncbi:uncharacterized protein PV09_04060 [Verruconis gallopava]|uniref:U3 small nucleolar RNA-associated protein 10 n=1 Tax=Verruconis gallopava TaxID=253628 RepID=A0A0D2AEK5_9PEZI|nr:uncharacterized protein PV09_04060 [Verruconis gallopava]KIW04885.1 hypothetical protein PV09_04060 [Verruconis gallopava]
MATALQRQLAAIAANSTHQLDLKAQKAAHSKSLLFDSKVAAAQDFNTIYRICLEGYEDLCTLDARFSGFAQNIFSEQSKSEERGLMTAEENKALDVVLENFLVLVSGRLLLKPAQKAVEWLIRRFRVHEHNTEYLILSFLPYHGTPLFLALLSILPKKIPHTFRFLYPSMSTMENPPFHMVLYTATNTPAFFAAYNSFILRACQSRYQAPAVMSFWASLATQAVDGMISAAQSGRDTVQRQKQEDLLLRVLPMLNEALSPPLADVNELTLTACMIITVLSARANLEDHVLDTLMEAVAMKWTPATIEARLTCISVLAESRQALELSKSVTKKLLKLENVVEHLVACSSRMPTGRLVLGLILRDVRSRAKSDGYLSTEALSRLLRADTFTEREEQALCNKVVSTISSDEVTESQRDAFSTIVEYIQQIPRALEQLKIALNNAGVAQDTIESTLQTTLLLTNGIPTQEVDGDEEMNDVSATDDAFDKTLSLLSKLELANSSFLSLDATDDYAPFRTGFAQALASESYLEKLLNAQSLRNRATSMCVPVLTLLLRVAFDASVGQLGRVTALRCIQKLVKTQTPPPVQIQFLVPYLIAAMADKAGAIRQAAAEIIISTSDAYKTDHKHKAKPENEFQQQTYSWQIIPDDTMRHLIDQMLVPNVEEFALDAHSISSSVSRLLQPNAESKTNKASKQVKTAQSSTICDYLASHAAETTLPQVKLQLLKVVNEAGQNALHAQETILVPALKQALSTPLRVVNSEKLEHTIRTELEPELYRVVTPESTVGLDLLHTILSGQIANVRYDMVRGAYKRLAEIWSSIPSDSSAKFAGLLLDTALQTVEAMGPSLYRDLASETIRSLTLSGHVLSVLLNSLPNALSMPDAPPATKRRRTSRSEKVRLAAAEPADLSAALAKYTLVLELVEGNKPGEHPELLQALFHVLDELQNFRLQTQSGLIYLQGLTINCMLAIVEKTKNNIDSSLDKSNIRTDLIVDCIRHSTSAQVQSSALLLISSLASWQPDAVVHSIMPIFTFMGNTILRQGDEYSAHVTEKTVSRVVPPLVESFRKKNKDIVIGASNLLLSFTAAFEHIPLHRRLVLFEHVVRTIGAEDSLYALVAMLIDAYPTDSRAKSFVAELLNQFEPSTSLKTIRKCLDLVWDIFRPRHITANSVLNLSERPKESHDNIASNLLSALSELLNDRQLREQISKSFESGDIDSANAQRMACVELIQEAIRLSQFLKSKPALVPSAANVLASIVNLLPTIELVQCSETLLTQKDDEVRLVSVGAVASRAREVINPSSADVTSLLGFMAKLMELLQESDNTVLCSEAVTCLGQVSKRFGRKDTSLVVKVAQALSSDRILKHADRSVLLVSVSSLTITIKVLKDEFISLVPMILPVIFKHLESGISYDTSGEMLKALNLSLNCIGFIYCLVEHLPFLMTGDYLDTAFLLLAKAAATPDGVERKLKESRNDLLRLIAKSVEADEVLAALGRNFKNVASFGNCDALVEYFGAARVVITSRPKSAIIRNSSTLFELFLQAFDQARVIKSESAEQEDEDMDHEDENDENSEIERVLLVVFEVALAMVMKLNDATFRPFIVRLSEWATQLPKKDVKGRMLRSTALFKFVALLFGRLKSLVTSYTTYVLDLAANVLENTSLETDDEITLLAATLAALNESFTHDDEQFWQAPHHFTPIATPLAVLLEKTALDEEHELVAKVQASIVSLCSATSSQDQHKMINTSLLKMLRHEDPKVRLASLRTERQLCESIGDEWLGMLPEMLPFVSELLEDDDKDVERAGKEWVRFLEATLGENLEL